MKLILLVTIIYYIYIYIYITNTLWKGMHPTIPPLFMR